MSFLIFARKSICSTIFTPTDIRPILACFFSSNPDLKNPPFMVNDYLISTFGFSPAKAAIVSKPIAHLKSPQIPDAVRCFLHHHGFGEDQVKAIIARRASILCSSPENILGPNLLALHNMGLSPSAITQIILSGPAALQLCSAVPRIKFWKDFVGGKEAALVRLFRRNMGLINLDIAGGIAQKMSFMHSRGIPTRNIQWIVCTVPLFITRSLSLMEDLLKRAQELGFQPESKMFAHGLQAMTSITREAMRKKMELFKSFGWSDDEFLSAVRKFPNMVLLSENNLRAKMDFLLGEAKCDMSYITFRPFILSFSLEKRSRPRNHVLHLLESKGLSEKKEFCRAIELTEDKFVKKYILPHRDTIPELHEAYLAACASGSG